MVEQILLGVWPPLLVAVPALLLAWRRRRGMTAPSARRASWSVGVAIGGGLFVALSVLQQVPPLPAVTGTQWLAWAAVVAALFAIVDAVRPLPRVAWWGIAVAMALAASALGLWRLWEYDWGAVEGAMHAAAAAVVCLVLAAIMAQPATVQPGPVMPLALVVVFGGAGHVLAEGGSALFGQLAGACAAVFGACTAAAVYNGAFCMQRGGAFAGALVLGGLLVQGRYFADVPVLPLALVAAAPSAIHAERLVSGRPVWQRAAVVLALAAVPLAIAVWSVSAGAEDPYAEYR